MKTSFGSPHRPFLIINSCTDLLCRLRNVKKNCYVKKKDMKMLGSNSGAFLCKAKIVMHSWFTIINESNMMNMELVNKFIAVKILQIISTNCLKTQTSKQKQFFLLFRKLFHFSVARCHDSNWQRLSIWGVSFLYITSWSKIVTWLTFYNRPAADQIVKK